MKRRSSRTEPRPVCAPRWSGLPHPEARLRLHQGALSRLEEKSRMAVRGICHGQPLSEPQAAGQNQPTAGPSSGVVYPPEAKRGLRRTKAIATRKENADLKPLPRKYD